jgi:hypothetical protein
VSASAWCAFEPTRSDARNRLVMKRLYEFCCIGEKPSMKEGAVALDC